MMTELIDVVTYFFSCFSTGLFVGFFASAILSLIGFGALSIKKFVERSI